MQIKVQSKLKYAHESTVQIKLYSQMRVKFKFKCMYISAKFKLKCAHENTIEINIYDSTVQNKLHIITTV